LASLRQLAPALRAKLAASVKAVNDAGFAFEVLPRVISWGDKIGDSLDNKIFVVRGNGQQ